MIVGIAERRTPQILAKHRPEGEPNLNIVGGENEFLDTADNRERVAVVAPTASYHYVQPNTSEWVHKNIAGIAHPKLTRDITVFPNASYKITSMERPIVSFKEAFRPKSESITRGSFDIGCNERSKASFKEASRVHPESMIHKVL